METHAKRTFSRRAAAAVSFLIGHALASAAASAEKPATAGSRPRVVRVYPVAVGADKSPTPEGTFAIVNRITNPTYYRRGKVIPSGAFNPLGTRWIGLDIKGFGIHGTDAPRSIGYRQSHGCIRMLNRDVEELFEQLRPGDLVELHGERTPELAELFVG